ncbi:alpha/beta hydrolase [Fulvivirga ligni]|uniref:alpha/beta hydrolase n=1 Tax=Fulvivirga ligni TaxID=2904246 RepID=UPI001F2AE89E|nr:alpha/beta hydrolase family protein [Fulvivirga ligni]UII24106.1 esterase family protein [Fulvivirga ligni]
MKYYVKYFLLFFLFSTTAFAAEVDTVTTHSTSMNKDINAVVITPKSYSKKKQFPVVYLLHGYSGNYKEWVRNVPKIKDLADQYGMIIVCPDGNYGSWYMDSPVKKESKFETYIVKELVSYVDKNYSTIAKREGRAITGLSMGGHGGLYLAFRNQDVFASAGSMSGGVDLKPFPNNWELASLLGTYAEHPENWEANSVIELTHLLTPNSLAISIECGTDDFFYAANVKLHEKLVYHNIPHRFTSSPGGHTWEFWSNAIDYQLAFFNVQFNKK